MFGLFKKKVLPGKAHLLLHTDIHSHILPGIDDGAPDIVASLKLLSGMYELGVRKMIATPHIIGDLYRNDASSIHRALEELKTAAVAAGIAMELSAAAEYMMDDHFTGLLKNGTPLLKLYNKWVLTEQSYATPVSNLKELAFELQTNGYKPVMAHPERYLYYHGNKEAYHRLKDLGFLLQVNLLSVTGYYGKSVARAAKFILEEGLADFVGTDLHHEKHLAALQQHSTVINQYLERKQYNAF